VFMSSLSQRPQDERLVIGIAGRIGSGKTSAGKYLESRYGFQYLRYSQVLSEWLATTPESKTHLQETGWEVMAGGMQSELNRRLISQIAPDLDVAVDGLRHPTDYVSLRNSFLSSFRLVYIDSPRKDRWERLKDRGRYATLNIFEVADSHPVEQHIELLRANAAVVLNNKRSLEDLYIALDDAVQRFKGEGQT
jgi:dephospho-CoA kinase